MGTCCSTKPHEPSPAVQPSLGQHHSLFVHPSNRAGSSNSYSIVYRPPHLNQRLAPGESRPRFWLSPTLLSPPGQPIVSVAWIQQDSQELQPQQLQQQQVQQQPDDPKENHQQQELQQRDYKQGFRLKSPARAIRWAQTLKAGPHLPSLPGQSKEDSRTEGSVLRCNGHSLTIKAYPPFLMPYVDKVLRLRLVFTDPLVEQMVGEYGHLRHGGSREDDADPMMETSHLVRNVHSLKVQFKHSGNLQGLPDMAVVESHGGVKRLRRVRYRTMPVTWIDLDHRKPLIKAVGEQFELTLGPPSAALTSDDFYDGNGETPTLLGTYERALDTCPERRLMFSVRLYNWFNQAVPAECYSDLSDICEQTTPQLGELH
ncbi:hypothetical protein ElyMa_000111500 [Elysia marginata]|uniref:Uncharacterized protein n=1 Tax=Elysia marginata TaxID=1093978 RepID=A0AAV4ELX3_9GAST|nr:hypothetical protein ElyMa_000111500 [Elysia marginata]